MNQWRHPNMLLLLRAPGRRGTGVKAGPDPGPLAGTRAEQTLLRAALRVGRQHQFEQAHGLQVARLALSLFDQLQGLHNLAAKERRLLLAAAVLHDIGQSVSYKKHHKHSLDLLSQAALPGVSFQEMQVVANVARYHRKAEPAPHHPAFVQLGAKNQQRVLKLGALLRLADGLDRRHQNWIKDIVLRPQGDDLVLHVRAKGDIQVEKAVLAKKSQLFLRVFGLAVRLAR